MFEYSIAFKQGLKPDPDLTVTEWADQYLILPKRASPEPGRYQSSRTPYMREIGDVLSPSDPTSEICMMKVTQFGGTQLGINWLGYIIDIAPDSMLMVFPTVEAAQGHSKQKIAPIIAETPRLRDKIKDKRSRDSGNTIQVKEFPGGILFLAGSNSAVSFRGRHIRYLFLDDIDGYERDVEGEGDPLELAKKRTDTYANRKKIFSVSTPTIKGISRIEKEFNESDQRYYHVPCPYCGHMQRLRWGGPDADFGIKFIRNNGRIDEAWYECAECHRRIDEYHKTEMLEKGRWIPTHPEREKRGYQISSLYSPLGWVSWKEIAKEFLEAKDDRERLKVWTNARLGEPFEEAGDQPEWVNLKTRAEQYSIMTVPQGGMLLTTGVDVQKNRLVVTIRAWGPGEENWLIWFGEIYGDPTEEGVWMALDALLERSYPHESGIELRIISLAIDAGHHTQEVYNYCRKRFPRVIPVKGQSQAGKPVIGRPTWQDVTWQGVKIENGVQLWPVGTDTAKSTIYGRLKMEKPGPGFYHFPIGLEDEYYLQLTAEKIVTRYSKGFPVMEWIKMRPRNDALDCFDDQTQVLTKEGWRYFEKLNYYDEIATVNLSNDTIEYQMPLHIIKKRHNGKMVTFKSQRLDIVVTPNHRMLVNRVKSNQNKKAWSNDVDIMSAKHVKSFMALKTTTKWIGNNNDTFFSNLINIGGKIISAEDWAEFLGWYISEGHCFSGRSRTQGNMRWRIHISQNPGGKADKIKDLLNKLPWKWHLSNGRQFTITSKDLYLYIQECGKGVSNKKVPKWIKNAPSNIIEKFLNAAIAGDGWTDKRGHRTYTTISKQLADDMQELFLKIGKAARIKLRYPKTIKGGSIRNRPIKAKNIQYNVSEIKAKRAYLYHFNRSSCINEIEYSGNVFCATVPNGTLICRRNGKPFIAGNCEVYAYAAAIRAGLNRIDWTQFERELRGEKAKPERQSEKPQKQGWIQAGKKSWLQR